MKMTGLLYGSGPIFASEVIKLRRLRAPILLIGPAVLVVSLILLVSLQRQSLSDWQSGGITQLRLTVNAVWCYFMFPLVTALIVSIIFSYEHRNHTWGLMRLMPISLGSVFVIKFTLAWMLAMLATGVLYSTLIIAILALQKTYSLRQPLDFSYFISNFFVLSAACLPLVALQSLMALASRSIIVPLVVAILATLLVAPIGSTRLWFAFPWSYPLVALNASNDAARFSALICGLILGPLLLALGVLLIQKRLIKAIEA
jgi:hypothetical protein